MKRYLFAAGLLLASLASSQALLLSFDSGVLTAGTGDPLSSAFTIDFATLETLDSNGDPLANPYWAIDGSAPAVTAGSPSAEGWGASSSNALDVRDQPVLFTFTSAVDLAGFSAVLDNSTLGNLGTEQIRFYDNADVLLASINLSQNVPGFVASTSATLTGVKKILLPTAAFYDNLNLTPAPGAIPEASHSVLAGLGAMGLLLRRRRAGV